MCNKVLCIYIYIYIYIYSSEVLVLVGGQQSDNTTAHSAGCTRLIHSMIGTKNGLVEIDTVDYTVLAEQAPCQGYKVAPQLKSTCK